MLETIDKDFPWEYFDGAVGIEGCGGGVVLYLSDSHYFHLKMSLGPGTNNYSKLNSLIFILIFSLEKRCNMIHIFGDSKIIINWFNNNAICHVHTLRSLLDEILALKNNFDTITVTHIYRQRN